MAASDTGVVTVIVMRQLGEGAGHDSEEGAPQLLSWRVLEGSPRQDLGACVPLSHNAGGTNVSF